VLKVTVFWVWDCCAAFLAFVAANAASSAVFASALDNRSTAVGALQIRYFHM